MINNDLNLQLGLIKFLKQPLELINYHVLGSIFSMNLSGLGFQCTDSIVKGFCSNFKCVHIIVKFEKKSVSFEIEVLLFIHLKQ